MMVALDSFSGELYIFISEDLSCLFITYSVSSFPFFSFFLLVFVSTNTKTSNKWLLELPLLVFGDCCHAGGDPHQSA